MKPDFRFLILFLFIIFQTSCSIEKNPLNRESQFNNDWKFIRTDVSDGEQTNLDDSDWRIVDLPHDFSIEDLPTGQAGLPEKEGVKQIGPFSEESAGGAST